ncbi:hypothetical protein HZU73_09976 [Apis mellifera caucasica]|nr:hypothetical protein HZU73_09976 [Apis mellifera caucasica]KAG9429272.1 hypothetical protein HZU67_08601 [Apis mellifera carnica]
MEKWMIESRLEFVPRIFQLFLILATRDYTPPLSAHRPPLSEITHADPSDFWPGLSTTPGRRKNSNGGRFNDPARFLLAERREEEEEEEGRTALKNRGDPQDG